ncbi:hypothetical protein MLD38_037361 [Melastoma candidum]|uniref:Uncharacterized protein n=1 Tax=Melastoma candidum TaxID=119954 RepID=A0ACB9LMG2_9MYRT|nr:hypothetical protein MLD38_037361 [Melastoma candidum]
MTSGSNVRRLSWKWSLPALGRSGKISLPRGELAGCYCRRRSLVDAAGKRSTRRRWTSGCWIEGGAVNLHMRGDSENKRHPVASATWKLHIRFCQAPGKGCRLDLGRAPSQLQPKKNVVVAGSLLLIVIEVWQKSGKQDENGGRPSEIKNPGREIDDFEILPGMSRR